MKCGHETGVGRAPGDTGGGWHVFDLFGRDGGPAMNEETRAAIQELLDYWDMGWLRAVSVVNIPVVNRAMMELRRALWEEKQENHETGS